MKEFVKALRGIPMSDSAPMLIALLICTIYGFLSTSTPDKIGSAEVGIAGLLILMIGVRGAVSPLIFMPGRGAPILIKAMAIFLIVVPTIVGLIFLQNSLIDYIRDIVPLFYALLPVFIYPRLKRNPDLWLHTLVAALFVAGLGFTVQYYLDPSIDIDRLIVSQAYGENRDNPWQDPATVFAFTFSLCAAIYFMSKGAIVVSSAFLLAYSLMMVMYLSTVSRGPIGLSLLAGVATAFLTFRASTVLRRLVFVIMLCAFGVAAYMLLSSSAERLLAGVQMLFEKTDRSGLLNARDIELGAVLEKAVDPVILIAGQGWGGLISNPIGGGARWSFVHNSFAYFLFKTGIFGLFFYTAYMGWCLRGYRYFFRRSGDSAWISVLLIVSAPALIVTMLLEVSYKTLSFGFLLSLLLAAYFSVKNSQSKTSVLPRGKI